MSIFLHHAEEVGVYEWQSLEVGGVDESWVEEREEDKGERDPASMILAQKEIEKKKE